MPYLQSLGVDIVWLSPLYESPQADMGYDISDYRNVDPRYGTLEDWDEVLHALHERGMKLVMDLVVNHSSEEVSVFAVRSSWLTVYVQHPWFKESRSSRDNPKRDWYIWRDAKYNDKGERVPPNNWRSVFGQYVVLTTMNFAHNAGGLRGLGTRRLSNTTSACSFPSSPT